MLYNADDCFSTLSLRDWLEHPAPAGDMRVTRSRALPCPTGAPEAVSERQQKSAALAEALLANIPADPETRNDEEAARWLLANLLDWHRRESKAEWWEYFRLKDLTDEELLDERAAISGLEFVGTIESDAKDSHRPVSLRKTGDKYSGRRDVCRKRGEKIGEVVAIDIAARTIDIKKTKKTAAVHPTSVFVDGTGPNTDVIGGRVIPPGHMGRYKRRGFRRTYRAARDLLLRRPPRLLRWNGLTVTRRRIDCRRSAKRIVVRLDDSVLAIQGPPGAGKTFTGARMICELVRQGKKVGITAMSHKVIRNLLDEVIRAAPRIQPRWLAVRPEGEGKPEEDDRPVSSLRPITRAACGVARRCSGRRGHRMAVVARGLFRSGRRAVCR